MKTNREIRRESFARTFAGRWFARMLLVVAVVVFVNNLANGVVELAYRECQVQTWGDYLAAKIEAMQTISASAKRMNAIIWSILLALVLILSSLQCI